MVHEAIRAHDLRFAEFFSGIGLMRMGLERSSRRWRCVFANDIDESKRNMYAAHYRDHDGSVDKRDVHTIPGSGVPDIDLATASFPCTDLSIAGGRAGIRSGESSAFWGFFRVLEEMAGRRPRVVLLENVVGFLQSNGGHDFFEAMRAMNSLGYGVDPFILDAKWFVPQSRQRLFVVCTAEGLCEGHRGHLVPESRIRPSRLSAFIQSNASEIQWSLRDLPEPPRMASMTLRDIVQDPPRGHVDWWSEDRVEYLYDQMFPRHQAWVEANLHGRRYNYATAFRRVRPQEDGTKRSMAELRTDGIAGCLRTPRGGSGRQILVRVGHGRLDARLMSGRECAALMGASGFRLSSTTNQILFGFGDAVCVDAICWIAQHYLEPVLLEAGRALPI